MSSTLVQVVAAVIMNEAGEFLLSSRPEGKAYAGYWEFAGGKVEAGETEFAALQRELYEELGIRINHATPWLTKIHHYEHASVHLRFFRVLAQQWQGDIICKERQQCAWQRAGSLDVSPMLPANGPILKALGLPWMLEGNAEQGWSGRNGVGAVTVKFDQDGTCLQLLHAGEMESLILQLQALELSDPSVHSNDSCLLDGWYCQPKSAEEWQAVMSLAADGMSEPVAVICAQQDMEHLQQLQETAFHILVCTDSGIRS